MLDHPPRHLQARDEMNENGLIQHSTDKSDKPVDRVLYLVNQTSLTDTSAAIPTLTIAILSS